MTIAQENRRESLAKSRPEFKTIDEQIYALLTSHPGGMTSWEMAKSSGRMVYVIRPNLTRACQRGALREAGKRFCVETGRNETVYQLNTGMQPEFAL